MRSRRGFLAGALGSAAAALLSGCDSAYRSKWLPGVLGIGESLNRVTQRLISSRKAMAQEFDEKDLSPHFRSNGTSNPQDVGYQALASNQFADWRLKVGGLVRNPATFSLQDLQTMPQRTQITRHDCVEGWSAIGKWTGVQLSRVLQQVQPLQNARFVVFYCADPMYGGDRYYESIDLDDANHPQTILAHTLNDVPLPIANGAPLRVRIERQLGYKMAKYLVAIDLVESLGAIGQGKGGYWEDRGYEWYAGI